VLDVLAIEVGRRAANVAQPASRAAGIDGSVAEEMAIVNQFFDGDTFPHDAEAQAGPDGDDAEGGMGAAGPEPELLAGKGGYVIGDDDFQTGALPDRSGQVDVAPAEERSFAHQRSVRDDPAEGDADAVQ
jgi:hypothetical protein